MAAVDIEPGTVEQVIYTWSSVNSDGSRGQGFGEISPGLRANLAWLKTWPTDSFQPFHQIDEADAYEGWRDLVTIGSFAIEDYNVVYRKFASAGRDAHGRNRLLVHALIGHRNDIYLGRLPGDSDVWLSAEACPLDKLPTLSTVKLDDYQTANFTHDDLEVDEFAQSLLDGFDHGDIVTLLEIKTEQIPWVQRALHVAVPGGLWPEIGAAWFADSSAPRLEVQIGSRPPYSNSAAIVERAGLAGCALHASVEAAWRRGEADQTWPIFLRRLREPPTRAEEARTDLAIAGADNAGSDEAGAELDEIRALILAGARQAPGDPDWNFSSELSDAAFVAVTRELRGVAALRAWFLETSSRELRAVFGGLTDKILFAQVERLLSRAEVPTELLATRWRQTTAASLGYAAVRRSDITDLGGSWAVPRGKAEHAAGDVSSLFRNANHEERLSLLSGGLGADRQWLAVTVREMLAISGPEYLFRRLLIEAELDSRLMGELLTEHIDVFGEWLRIPDTYVEALRLAIGKAKLHIWRLEWR